jgi:hypothetical protein
MSVSKQSVQGNTWIQEDEVNIMRNFSVVMMLKSRKLQWAECAARIMEAVNAYGILRNLLGSCEDQERKWENKMTVDPNMMGREADGTGSGLYTTVGVGVNGVDSSG